MSSLNNISKVRKYIKENWSGKDMEEYLAKRNSEWLSKLKEEEFESNSLYVS